MFFKRCHFVIQRKIKQGKIIPENRSLYPKLNIVKTNDFTEYRQTLFGLLWIFTEYRQTLFRLFCIAGLLKHRDREKM